MFGRITRRVDSEETAGDCLIQSRLVEMSS